MQVEPCCCACRTYRLPPYVEAVRIPNSLSIHPLTQHSPVYCITPPRAEIAIHLLAFANFPKPRSHETVHTDLGFVDIQINERRPSFSRSLKLCPPTQNGLYRTVNSRIYVVLLDFLCRFFFLHLVLSKYSI